METKSRGTTVYISFETDDDWPRCSPSSRMSTTNIRNVPISRKTAYSPANLDLPIIWPMLTN